MLRVRRRRFLWWLIGGAIVMVGLASCGQKPAPPNTPPVDATPGSGETAVPGEPVTPSAVPTATPEPFKPELVLCMTAEPDRLVGSTMSLSDVVRSAVLPSAVSYGDDYIAEPVLLESLPSVEEGTLRRDSDGTIHVTLKYREALVWSDGEPFDSADAVLGMSLPARSFDPDFEVLDVRRIDERTLEVTVDSSAEYPYVPPQPPLPRHVLGTGDSLPEDLDSVEYLQQANPSLGPYRVTEWVHGSHMLLNANPYAVPLPVIPVVRVRFLPDPNQLVAELNGGGCDVAVDGALSLDQAPALLDAQNSGQVRMLAAPASVYEQVVFNAYPDPATNVPYFADPRVRQAVAKAIDRAALAQQATQGFSPVLDSWLPPDHWAYPGSQAVTQYALDLSAAAQLLDAAGWSDADGDGVREYHGNGGTYACQRGDWSIEEGTPLAPTLITTDQPARAQAAEALRTGLAQIGVSLQVQTLPATAMFAADGPVTRRTFDLALFGAATRPDPGGISRWVGQTVYMHPVDLVPVHFWGLEERWTTSEQLVETLALNNTPSASNNYQGQNFGGWCHDEANLIIIAANRAVDVRERQSAYAQHQGIWSNDLPALPLYARPRIAAARSYVCGSALGPFDILTWNLAAWYWDETGACSE